MSQFVIKCITYQMSQLGARYVTHHDVTVLMLDTSHIAMPTFTTMNMPYLRPDPTTGAIRGRNPWSDSAPGPAVRAPLVLQSQLPLVRLT